MEGPRHSSLTCRAAWQWIEPTQHTCGLVRSLHCWIFLFGKLQLLEDVMTFFQGPAYEWRQCIHCIPDTLLCQMLFLPPHCGLIALKRKLPSLVFCLPGSWFCPWVGRQLVTYGTGFEKINHKLIWKLKQVLYDCGIAHCNILLTRFWLLRCIASTRTCTHVNAACKGPSLCAECTCWSPALAVSKLLIKL